MQLNWTPALNIGNEEIDKQHIALFGFLAISLMAVQGAKPRINYLNFMIVLKITWNTISRQKKLLCNRSISLTSMSTGANNRACGSVSLIFANKFCQGPTLMNIIQTNKALLSWLVQHVQDLEQTFGAYLKEHPPVQA